MGKTKLNSELENAFNKELNLIKNDLYYQQVEVNRNGIRKFVRYDVMYKPLEILAGDSYSIRKTKDGKIVSFLLDAMGKGISASITATTSTTLLNYIFDQIHREGNFEFERWIKRFIEYIKGDLLENEMLAIILSCYDKNTSIFKYASFGIPAFLLVDENGKLKKIKSNNPPINVYTDDYVIDEFSLKEIKKALFYTDGLCENRLEDGSFYKEKMYQDFAESDNIMDFINRVNESIEDKADDLTFFYINTIPYNQNYIVRKVPASKEALDGVLVEISEYLKKQETSTKVLSEISLALSELLNNALEHGVYGISNSKKSYLIENGLFDDELNNLAEINKEKTINVKYTIINENDTKIFVARIEDEGKGFDVRSLKHLVVNPEGFNGRGIMIIKKLLDRIYFNEEGNCVTIRKFL